MRQNASVCRVLTKKPVPYGRFPVDQGEIALAPAGRPPKPIEEKRRTGNPGKRQLPSKSSTAALEPVVGIPPTPIEFAENPVALSTWNLIWTSEAQRWLSPRVDRITVESVCYLAAEVSSLRKLAMTQPLLEEPIVTPTGLTVGSKIVANPAVNMLRKAQAQLTKELSDLGFNPTARSRLGLAEVKRESVLQQLLANSGSNNNRQSEDSQAVDAEIVHIAADN